ncbi:PREDICTED: uncharacterized protein LOC106741751 isoform X2 [Dinoponera quadriceps]|uniref:Uncharacterized protein LOC106741751 isoform X2 n=1 Tax=Dinoponera quadriceps TaxID=609295 RepID=A0A6P3WUI8_DINQU|nr:PREDICTED: uncharacterized protein LOC106741751 isoform X2 [Dinoponera quadriceps]
MLQDDCIETNDEVVKMQADEESEKKPVNYLESNLVAISNEDLVKPEVKVEQILIQPCDYDEIDEKLKQICGDDDFEENNSNNIKKSRSIFDKQEEVTQQASDRALVHRSINYKDSPKGDIGEILTSNMEDIEIIFSTENGEEEKPECKYALDNNDMADEIGKLEPCTSTTDNIDKDDIKEVEQDISVTPNIMAAMRRKRKTRDEIMKSLEKSIYNISSQDTDSTNYSDVASDDTVEVENKKRKIQVTQDESSSDDDDTSPTTMRFTVKVTGRPDDVSDIMHNLSKSTGDANVQGYNDAPAPRENDGFVTSVITIDDCAADVNDKGECHDDDTSSFYDPFQSLVKQNNRVLPSTSRSSPCHSTRLTPDFDDRLKKLSRNKSCLTPIVTNTTQSQVSDYYTLKCEYDKLQRKSSTQADVVKELSNQLIQCKRLEHGLQVTNATLEKKIQNMRYQLNALTNNVSPPTGKKEDANVGRTRLVDDLSVRLSYFEQANKRLMRDVDARNERLKKLEKQKDNRIKELNWKLEKASKFLERAEKNSNTYRRKMLNMQTFLRRKKILDDRMTRMSEILIAIIKKSYAGRTLSMSTAVEISRTCGMNGYDRLLSSGLPLPAMSAVRIASDNLSDSTESTNEILRAVSLRRNVNEVHDTGMYCAGNDAEVVPVENVESVAGEIALDDTETVMGTVQDIFDESNNDDDFSTNELTEDFISQLSKFM